MRELAAQIRRWGAELGFQQVGIAGTELGQDAQNLKAWLDAGMHGDMTYMARHGTRRVQAAELVPGTGGNAAWPVRRPPSR